MPSPTKDKVLDDPLFLAALAIPAGDPHLPKGASFPFSGPPRFRDAGEFCWKPKLSNYLQRFGIFGTAK